MKFILSLSLITVLCSCSSGNSEKTTQDTTSQQQQVVIPAMKKGDMTDLSVASDPGNSYTVYLPANYDSTKKYPVVIFFDAHANGHLPLTNYKSLADKWGYIFVGSNSSKNGLDMEVTKNIGVELIDETEAILPVDPNQVLLCGFSGGSRVAAFMAQGRPDVKGVICNSAAPQEPLTGKFYIGLAGLGDMNYLEMKTFSDRQPLNKFPHDLLVFDGKHEWAPLKMMEDALLMATIYNANGKFSDNDHSMAQVLCNQIVEQSDSIMKTSCSIANNLRKAGKNACDPLGEWKIEKAKNISDACVKSDEADWITAESHENALQKELSSAIMQQDTSWWKTNAPKYFETTKTGAEKFMRERLRGYTSLLCYSYINQAMQTNNLHAAEKLITVYSIVDPTNSEWAYMRATLYMKIGMNDYALAMLSKAVDIGFSDRARLQNDPTFQPLQASPGFSEVISKMK